MCAACADLSHCSGKALTVLSSVPQGLPGPPGDKGENGDVGAMVSAATFIFGAFHCAVVESPSEDAIMKLNTRHFSLKSMFSQ